MLDAMCPDSTIIYKTLHARFGNELGTIRRCMCIKIDLIFIHRFYARRIPTLYLGMQKKLCQTQTKGGLHHLLIETVVRVLLLSRLR